ncbi:[NiFe] hydrogenase metallocenter assembly protein HypF [Hydrogenimonas sp.]|nr:[NiFe] hydrogenase metallocenter assembly protein HypF [Hydrogenimonas sp.]
MAFVFEIEYSSPNGYIAEFAEALAKEEGAKVSLLQNAGVITLIADEADPNLAGYLEKLAELLPASCFMGSSSHRLTDGPPVRLKEEVKRRLPHSIAPCPKCMKEIFDPSSRRYYYPFTGCNCCGAQYPFFEKYPFIRQNSLMSFFEPCEECANESRSNPFRLDYPLISCHRCGIPVRVREGRRERFANDPASFKKLFEAAAGAICDGKRVAVKTLFGYRLFYDAESADTGRRKVMMVTDASKLGSLCSLIDEEIHALLSIERPLIEAAVADETLFGAYGRFTRLKYPDEGFTTILAKELLALGRAHVAYETGGDMADADMVIEFDLPTQPQKDCTLFINRSVRFFVEGERSLFPISLKERSDRIVVAYDMAAVPEADRVVVDRMEKFGSAEASSLYLLEGEEVSLHHSNTIRFSREIGSVLSVLREHGLEKESAVGVYFRKEPTFIYHNGKKPIVAVPAIEFDSKNLRRNIESLREESRRLVENFSEKFPGISERLFGGAADIFEAASIIAGLPDPGFDTLSEEALKFGGKGGLKIDTRLKNSRFDPYTFLSSLISYRLGGAESELLAYSAFESLADYISETLGELKVRSKAEHTVLCGRAFGSQSLFSRVRKSLEKDRFLMNIALPIDRENAIIGALAL